MNYKIDGIIYLIFGNRNQKCFSIAQESGLQQKMEPLIKSANFVGEKDNITALY